MNQTNQLNRTMTRILLAFMLILTGYAGGYAQAVDFTQAANKSKTTELGQVYWIGSILNDSKSDYYEGMAVPQRIILTGLTPNQQHTFYFSFSSIKGNTHSYDFITSWDKAISVANFVGNKLTPGSSLLSNLISEQCGEAIPSNYVAVCTMATKTARVTIPSPSNPTTNPNGSNIAAIKAAFEGAFSGEAGLLLKSTQDISGATMTFEGYSGADMDGTYKLVWNSGAATTAVIQFAGHLALGAEPSRDWAGIGHGNNFGAGAVSGAPYHINLGNVDESSLGNQDNQIQSPLILGCDQPTATAGVDQAICQGSTATLTGDFGGSASSGTWTSSGNGSFSNSTSKNTVYTPSAGDIANGSVTLTFTTNVVGTCGSAADAMILTINANPSIANAGADQTQCDNGSFTLAGNVPTVGTGVWSIVSGSATINTPSSATSTVTGVAAGGSVTLRWTISNGVCTSSTDDVVLKSDAKPTTANAGADQTQCDNGSFTLAGNVPTVGTGVWSIVGATNGASIADASSATSGVSGLTAGKSVTLSWTISNGVCTSTTDDVVLKSDVKPTNANAGTDQTQCDNGSFTLAGNVPTVGTGVWSIVGATNGASIADASSATSGVSGLTAGKSVTLSWTISNGVCTSTTDDVVLKSDAKPTNANAGTDQTQCDNGSFTLAGNVPTVGTGVWSIVGATNGASIADASSATSGVSGLTAGKSVTLSWTISNGVCTSTTDDVVLKSDAKPTTANAGTDQTQCDNGSFTLAGNVPTVGTGVWSIVGATNGASIADASSATSGVSGLTAGKSVTLSWTISNGVCTSTLDDVVLKSDAKPTTANAGADQTQCDNGSFTLAGNVPTVGTGVWSIVGATNGASIADASSATSGVSGLTAGSSVTLLWTISNGTCDASTNDVVLTNKVLPTFTLTPTASPCLGAPEGKILVTSTSGNDFKVILGTGSEVNVTGGTYIFNNLFGTKVYTVTVKQNGCEATKDVTVNDGTVVCYPFYTYSQGYYGNTNGNGVACIRGEGGLRTRQFIERSLAAGGGTLRLGNLANSKYFAVPNTTAAIDKLLLIMPGGGSPNALSGISTLPTVASTQLKNGKINTVLLGQAIAMWLNINIPGNELGSFDLKGLKCKTTIVTKEPSSASSCNTPFAGTTEVSTAFPQSVVTAMMTRQKTTVKDLVDFASEMLGQAGKTYGGVSFADMNSALDAIVTAFHGGKYFARFDGSIPGCNPPTTSNINVPSPVEDATAVKVENSNSTVVVNAFPNPYIDQVTFNVTVKNAGKGSLVIYNMVGQKVANLFEGNMQANSTQTIRYSVPFAQRKNLVYVFRQNETISTGKLVSGK